MDVKQRWRKKIRKNFLKRLKTFQNVEQFLKNVLKLDKKMFVLCQRKIA